MKKGSRGPFLRPFGDRGLSPRGCVKIIIYQAAKLRYEEAEISRLDCVGKTTTADEETLWLLFTIVCSGCSSEIQPLLELRHQRSWTQSLNYKPKLEPLSSQSKHPLIPVEEWASIMKMTSCGIWDFAARPPAVLSFLLSPSTFPLALAHFYKWVSENNWDFVIWSFGTHWLCITRR